MSEIAIRGSGGDEPSGGEFSEAPDTLLTSQFVEAVYLIGEGEIEGFAHGESDAMQDIYLDDTPVENPDGSINHPDVAVDWRWGTIDQTPIHGFRPPAAEQSVGVEIRNDRPVVRTISDPRLDALRITVAIQQFSSQVGNALQGTKVRIAIDLAAAGGPWVAMTEDNIIGKTTSGFARSYKLPLQGAGPWRVRLRRLTPDSTSTTVQDKVFWSSVTALIERRFNYPNRALFAARLWAKNFNSVPGVRLDLKFMRVQVPQNYNPITRAYATTGPGTSGGVWDGSFKTAWTDNTAWCWYDMATKVRYGLGEYIDVSMLDKFELYAIAQYCDELVPDGFGGTEPRFTFNHVFSEPGEPLEVMQNLAGAMRAMSFYAAGSVMLSQDRARDPVRIFTAANVRDGVFRYTGTARTARHTAAIVRWHDPANLFREEIEYVPLPDAMQRFGLRPANVGALGCTSRGQAHRLGKHLLLSEWEAQEVVSFSTGLEGLGVLPGEVIAIEDPARANERRGGRLLDSTASVLNLDAPITLRPGRLYTASVVLPDQTIEMRTVMWAGSVDTDVSSVSLNAPLSQVPLRMGMWAIASDDIPHELFRVLGSTIDGMDVEITALEHHPEIFDAIDNDTQLQPRPVSLDRTRPGPVLDLHAVTSVFDLNKKTTGVRVSVSWEPGRSTTRFAYRYLYPGGSWQASSTTLTSVDLDNVPNGELLFEVTPLNAIGRAGPTATLTYDVINDADIGEVTGLQLVGGGTTFDTSDAAFVWDEFPGADYYTVRITDGATEVYASEVFDPAFTFTRELNLASGGPRRAFTARVRAVRADGISQAETTLAVSNPAPGAPTLNVEAGVLSASVAAVAPHPIDVRGMTVWISTSTIADTPVGAPAYSGIGLSFTKYGLPSGTLHYMRVKLYDDLGAGAISTQVTFTPLFTGGIAAVPDATAITATTGSPPPGGDDYLAVYSEHNGRMYTWRPDLIPARYVSANSAADIEGTIAEAQLSAPFLGRIQDIEDFAADESTRVDVLESSVKGGGNLLPNAAFESDASGWEVGYNPGSYSYAPTRDNAGSAWTPIGGHQIGFNIVGAFSGQADITASPMQQACVPGARYCISAWLAAHRCDITFALVWLDSTGTYISEHHTPSVGRTAGNGDNGGTNVASWVRRHLFVTAPANARTVYVFLRMTAVAGLIDPYGWAYQPMLEQADANQSQPSPWAPSSAGIRARVASVEQAVADEEGARAIAISEVNARLNTGGDVRTAIVQVQSEATATADRLTATHSVTLSAGGTVSGLRAFNDGTTSALRIAADQVLFSPGELFDDPFFDNPDRWIQEAGGWFVEDVSLPGDNGPERLGVRRCVTLWSGVFSTADVRKHYYTTPFNLPCQPGEPLRISAKGRNAANHPVRAGLYFYDAADASVGAAELIWAPGATATYLRAIQTVPSTAVRCRVFVFNDQAATPGVAFSGVAEIGDIRLVRAVGASLVVDGSITATQIDAAYTNTTILSARTAVIDYAAINTLSAISANLGAMTAGTITLTGAGWNYLRTDSKWWNDGVNGWISAALAETNSHFQEFRAANGSALVLEQKGGGVDVGGLHYRLLVRDASGIDRLDIDPASGVYRFRGELVAASGSFTGNITSAATISGAEISGVHGTFDQVTAGVLRNDDDTASFHIDGNGNDPLLRAGERTLITHEGRTYFNNSIFGEMVSVGSVMIWDQDNGITKGEAIIDLGVDFNIGEFSDASFSAQVAGYSGVWGITNFRVRFQPSVCFLTPVVGADWDTSRLQVRVLIDAVSASGLGPPPSGGTVVINNIFLRVHRLT